MLKGFTLPTEKAKDFAKLFRLVHGPRVLARAPPMPQWFTNALNVLALMVRTLAFLQ